MSTIDTSNTFETTYLDTQANMILKDTQSALKVPQASLLGLPAELRLQIFSYLSEPIRFHVDSSHQDYDPSKCNFEHKRLCHTPEPVHASLCSTPRFSGLTPPASMCHNQCGAPTHRLAIRGVCKLFRSETRALFENQWIGMTIEHRTVEARSVLRSMSMLQLAMLVDLTIQVLPPHKSQPWTPPPPGGGSIATVLVHLRNSHFAFPNLRTLAIQAPKRLQKRRRGRWDRDYYFDPEGEWRWQWYIVELKEMYGDRVQIILQWWFVLRAGHALCSSGGDEMVRARGVVGNCEGVVYSREGCMCTFEMTSEPIVAGWGEWTEYWKKRGMGFDKEYSLTRGVSKYDKHWVKTHRAYVSSTQMKAWEANAQGHLRQAAQQVRCRH